MTKGAFTNREQTTISATSQFSAKHKTWSVPDLPDLLYPHAALPTLGIQVVGIVEQLQCGKAAECG